MGGEGRGGEGKGKGREEIWFGRYRGKRLGPTCLIIFLSIYFSHNIYMDASLYGYSYGNRM